MNVSLRQIRAFAVVARAESFTLAARQLSLTQSAVSMLVQQLESELGLRLFNRSRSAVTLTLAGRELLPTARRTLEGLRQMEESANDLRTLRAGTLRVAAPQLMACTWVAGALARFAKSHPAVGVTIIDGSADDIVDAVRRGDAEVGIGPERAVGEELVRVPLLKVPMQLVCAMAHPLAAQTSISWQELRNERWVVYSGDFSRYVDQRLHELDASLSLQTAIEVRYVTTALAMVGAGMGVAMMPGYAGSLAANFGVRFVPLNSPALIREFFLFRRKGAAQSPAAEAFAAVMKDHALEK